MTTASYKENARLDALHNLNLLDTPPSEAFDRITRMASQLFDAPISAVSLTDKDRQWFKSRVGVAGTELRCDSAPCATVTRAEDFIVVNDLATDDRFASGVLAQSGVRFYAGAPLVTQDGFCLGAMCILDVKPRVMTDSEQTILQDLAAMVMAQIELQHAFGRIDPTSGLPNRNQFIDDLTDLARDQAGAERALILVDIADPHQLTEALRVLGQAFVDEAVKAAVKAMKQELAPGTVVYQIGATQCAFLVVQGSVSTQDALVGALEARLKGSVEVDGIPVGMNMAIGIAPFRLGVTAPTDVLRFAHSAAQDARSAETGSETYSTAKDEVHRRRFGLLIDMPDALAAAGQLSLVYQPRLDMVTGQPIGAEALLRWQHPTLGNLAPGEFIPIVEKTGLARPVTEWVIDTALAQLALFHGEGLAINMSVNVAAPNLEEADFALRLGRALRRHDVRPDTFEIEFTESAIIRNRAAVLDQLQAVKALGVRCAIDDFGTGYSSFSYLRDIPAEVVKIDRSFMRALATEERDRRLVRSIITMAHELGYRVVAEGIETSDVYDLLASWGCDEAQGYLISRPVSADALRIWLKDHKGWVEPSARAA
jgi:EAL domain-containing protein (putative c-di-GMP-specific phosphodiesterase class I)/GGDEF domain-containing protein